MRGERLCTCLGTSYIIVSFRMRDVSLDVYKPITYNKTDNLLIYDSHSLYRSETDTWKSISRSYKEPTKNNPLSVTVESCCHRTFSSNLNSNVDIIL